MNFYVVHEVFVTNRGCAHEVGLPGGLAEEEAGEPGEAAGGRGGGALALLIRPHYPAPPGTLVWSATPQHSYRCCTGGNGSPVATLPLAALLTELS